MGNRAVITSSRAYDVSSSSDIGVYLHWNGGRDSVEAFLKYCELKGYRSPDVDCYGWARLCQVIGNFFGGSTSVGIDKCCNLDCDNWDNGTYIIKGWKIVDRKYLHGMEQNHYNLNEMLKIIDDHMPEKERLGDFLNAKEISVQDVKVGDVVFIFDELYNIYEKCTVVGIGDSEWSSYYRTTGVPYVDKYPNAEHGYAWNINNYIKSKTVRVCR